MHTSERSTAVHQLIQQDAQWPYIERVIVILVLNHFWGHVLEGTAKSVPLLHVIGLYTPSKITDLDNIALLDQNVLRFDISVNQTLFV